MIFLPNVQKYLLKLDYLIFEKTYHKKYIYKPITTI